MNRSELIVKLASQFPQLTVADIEFAVKSILGALSNQMAQGGRAEIRGFGSFSVHTRPPRRGRNPKTGESVQIPEKKAPHFKPGSILREAINGQVEKVAKVTRTGRPSTNGAKPGWELARSTIALEAFTRARNAGEKYDFALEAAVESVTKQFPDMKISSSMVKKILREFMSEDTEDVLSVSKVTDPSSEKSTYGVSWSARPQYPHPSKK